MERQKFYTIIDQCAEDWYIDATAPVKGKWGSAIHKKNSGPRKKTNYKGEENPINETSGEVHVLKWIKQEQMCLQCCKMVAGKTEDINLKNGQVKCSCGLKYPVIDIMLKKVEA